MDIQISGYQIAAALFLPFLIAVAGCFFVIAANIIIAFTVIVNDLRERFIDFLRVKLFGKSEYTYRRDFF